MDCTFTSWIRWSDRETLGEMSQPGVYVIALSDKDLSGSAFDWLPEVIYVGMTNSKGGLRSRLQQFDNTIRWREGHDGARRVRHRHGDYATLVPRLYVSVCARECDVVRASAADLRIMGEVARLEYDCLATFVDAFGELPEFNDKAISPKA